jgi:Arm DNA-binding domain
MYSKQNKRTIASTFDRNGVLWLNFRWEGKRYRITTGLPNTKEGNKAAQAIAQRIEVSLHLPGKGSTRKGETQGTQRTMG